MTDTQEVKQVPLETAIRDTFCASALPSPLVLGSVPLMGKKEPECREDILSSSPSQWGLLRDKDLLLLQFSSQLSWRQQVLWEEGGGNGWAHYPEQFLDAIMRLHWHCFRICKLEQVALHLEEGLTKPISSKSICTVQMIYSRSNQVTLICGTASQGWPCKVEHARWEVYWSRKREGNNHPFLSLASPPALLSLSYSWSCK